MRVSCHPSRSPRAEDVVSLRRGAPHAAQAAATAASASFASTSTSTIRDPTSGGSRRVAAPRTAIFQSLGATNEVPRAVVRGVSARRTSNVNRASTGAAGDADGRQTAVGLGVTCSERVELHAGARLATITTTPGIARMRPMIGALRGEVRDYFRYAARGLLIRVSSF